MTSTVEFKVINPEMRDYARPGGDWHPSDFSYWENPKNQNKIKKTLDLMAYDFNLSVMVGRSGSRSTMFSKQLICDDKINVVYTSNSATAANWKPMTSWILLHRLSHAMAINNPVFNSQYRIQDGPEYNLFAGLRELWHLAYSHPNYQYPPYIVDHLWTSFGAGDSIPAAGFLANHLFTMRSARDKSISTDLDIFAEAFTQFLHTGRFRMNRWMESNIVDLGHTDRFVKSPRVQTNWVSKINQDLTKLQTSIEVIDAKIEMIESDINRRMSELAKRMVGHQFVF